MNTHPALRPDLAAVCLFAKQQKRRESFPPPSATGVLAELARLRLCK
jgi:hypothetical protein